MTEIYTVNGTTYKVGPNSKEKFLNDFPNAVLVSEPGKTTPTTPGAVVEETAAPELTLTESTLVDTSLDLPGVKTDKVD